MAKRPKRAFVARLAVGLASLAFPLVVTGVAQAGIAGALPASMTNKPVLRAAAILSSNSLEVCFDKTVQLGSPAITGFRLAGYGAGNNSAPNTTAALDPTHTACAIVGFATTIDTSQYSVVEVVAGAVVSNASGQGNVTDSVGLTGSLSHSGTIGVTTQPNLVGIVPPDGPHLVTNTLTYVFDKNVATPNSGLFFYVNGGGNLCPGAGTPTVLNTTVTVAFPVTAACPTVGSAVRAGALTGAVRSPSDPRSTSVNQSAVIPGAPNNGATLLPDLVSTSLGSDNDSIVFTFDKNVVLPTGSTGAGTFEAELANGTTVTSTSAVATGGTSVTARFAGTLSVNAEFGVIGWAARGAVVAADNTTSLSVPGSGGIGDNAGAFARSFTTAPDVFGITINKTAGTISVNLDDRVLSVTPGDITLYTAAGDPIVATPTGTSFNSTAPPGPETVTISYPPSALTNVASVQFRLGTFVTNGLGATIPTLPGDNTSIAQLVGPISNAAVLKGFKPVKALRHAKTHKKAVHKKHAVRSRKR